MAEVIPVTVTEDPVERLGALFDDHHDRLYRLARRLTASTDDALDLVQETFLKAARFPKSVPVGATDAEAWLVRVLINLRRDQWRKSSVRDRHDRAQSTSSNPASSSQSPEATLIAKTLIWRALDILPPRRRAIVVMHELEGLAIPTIASLLGISTITVRWHLSAGRRDLTRALTIHSGDNNEKD